jgi:hypothetical protein
VAAQLFKNKFTWFVIFFYLVILIWWGKMFLVGQQDGMENYLFGAVYAVIALVGAVNGLFVSRIYGGWKSVIGRGIIFLSLGLIGEAFGQGVWSYYNLLAQVEVPYPSIGDIGYFSIIPLYTLGILSFAKASGANFSLRSLNGKLFFAIIPLVMLAVSYIIFLRDYQFDLSQPIKIFLDFGYPLGEAIYISLAIVTFILSKKLLGGIMRAKIIFLIIAFVIQYITDFSFLYTASQGTYYNGGFVDLFYATSFAVMSLVLLNFKFLNMGEQ